MDSADPAARADALSLLARADVDELQTAWASWENRPAINRIRGPEIGLVMVRGQIGGGGAPFNLGEATVARASVRIDSGEVGHGYCLGRDTDKAELIAVIDALYQREAGNVDFAILRVLRDAEGTRTQRQREEAAATKVEFFTLVRGEDE